MSNLVSTYKAVAVLAIKHDALTASLESAYLTACIATSESSLTVRAIVAAAKDAAGDNVIAADVLPVNSTKRDEHEAVALIAGLDDDGTVLYNHRKVIRAAIVRLGMVGFRDWFDGAESDSLTRGEAIAALVNDNGKEPKGKREPKDADIAALLKAAQGPLGKAEDKRKGGASLSESDRDLVRSLQSTLAALIA